MARSATDPRPEDPTGRTDLPRRSPPAPPEAPSLADRYYAMAEAMNTRGAMELAVPFYRQAMALLLAERDSLRQELRGDAAAPDPALDADALHGLLQAAAAWEQGAEPSPSPEAAPAAADLASRLSELEQELAPASAQQVLAGLDALSEEAGGLPADGHNLRGKVLVLLGRLAEALQSFEQALALAPSRAGLRINVAAARLANGDVAGALAPLRQLHAAGLDALSCGDANALLRNLASAEDLAGDGAAALALRREWHQRDPAALATTDWLAWVRGGLQGPVGGPEWQQALGFLRELHTSSPGDRQVLEVWALALEEQGDYRAASLLYRELLRPAEQPSPANPPLDAPPAGQAGALPPPS